MEAIIRLKPGKDKSIVRNHPWIFSGAIKSIEGPVQEGSFVEVVANKGRHLGYGHYQDGSIAVRVLLFEHEELQDNLYEARIASAWNLRKSLRLTDDASTNIFRLIHAEGDFLPGLIIDHYNGHLVIQCHSIGMYMDIEKIKSALITGLLNAQYFR